MGLQFVPLPVTIPDDGDFPFSRTSHKAYSPDEVTPSGPGETSRTKRFERTLAGIFWFTGKAVPYAFTTKDNQQLSMDWGCIKFLRNRAIPEIDFECGDDGKIASVIPLPALLQRYQTQKRNLFVEIGLPIQDDPSVLRFCDLVPTPESLMGVKAVWRRIKLPVMAFGARGEQGEPRYYNEARAVAERSVSQPYFVTIGGGARCPGDVQGRVLNLAKATPAYGLTPTFVQDEAERAGLKQWPVAVLLDEVFSIEGEPHVVGDLGFPDRTILQNAYDRMHRPTDAVTQLWQSLRDYPLIRNRDITLPAGFIPPTGPSLISPDHEKVTFTSKEGQRLWKLSKAAERDPRLKKLVKLLNRERNGGRIVCEACDFSDALDAMFDAHHLNPLCTGQRETRVDDLAVICPRCHRWVHWKTEDKLYPVAISVLRQTLRAL